MIKHKLRIWFKKLATTKKTLKIVGKSNKKPKNIKQKIKELYKEPIKSILFFDKKLIID